MGTAPYMYCRGLGGAAPAGCLPAAAGAGSQCARHKMSALLLPLDHVQLRALTQAGALDQESGPFEAGSLWTDRAAVVLCVRRPG
eukprot:COSAG01_NODE_356_length_18316_cov_24.401493_1_plen_85_part_00